MEDDDEEGTSKGKNGLWKPQVHFVWDLLLDEVLSSEASASTATAGHASFPEFFRILVDGVFLLSPSRCYLFYFIPRV